MQTKQGKTMGLRRLVGMSDCWVGSYLQIQGVILEISKRYRI